MRDKWLQKLTALPKKQISSILIFLGAAGLFLLIAGGGTGTAPEAVPAEDGQSTYTQQLEEKLEAVVSRIEGVGKVRIALTLEAGEETVYALDERSSSADSSETHHILMNSKGGQQPLVEMVWEPEVRGIAVVCQGAGNSAAEAQITEVVSVLTGVSANRISIAKMS